MPRSQPPHNATSLAGDWPPFDDQGLQSSANETVEADDQYFLDILNSLPAESFDFENQTMPDIHTDLALPHQAFFLEDNQFNATEAQQHEGTIPSNSMVDNYGWAAQPDNAAYDAGLDQADSMAGATMHWPSAPFDMDQWNHTHVVQQPMAAAPQTWAAPFDAPGAPIPTTQTAGPSATYASTRADAR